jgi:hypothetical protein
MVNSSATFRVGSPPQPNPGLPGFGHAYVCRKRASPQPTGEGLGVGVGVGGYISCNNDDPPPQPSPARGEGADRVCRTVVRHQDKKTR